ncbi:hypothetical protein ACJJIF_17995 [Microbulbifer sp. SSSA002]|uniref:hypothetical protein n=1 Tax=unclassified Microbulbifer TaxID=2619833 RepID=UPI00403983BD
MKYRMTPFRHLKLLILASLLAACSHTVQVDGNYPAPIGDQLPLTVGFYLSEDFKTFTYTEDSEDREEWNISTGPAQKNLFETVLGSMFTDAISLPSYPQDVPEHIELVIVPEVRELQFTMPRETRVNIFEVWIKYNMTAFDPSGGQVASWVITAYGKTPSAFLQSQEQALTQAINIALRDAGANLYTGFGKVPELQAFLSRKHRSLSLRELKMEANRTE